MRAKILLPAKSRPRWRLPQGISRGAWEYAHSKQIAEAYDAYFRGNQLFEFDDQVLARHFATPGRVVDLGCGTGRTLLPLARRGFPCVAVDLSRQMLRIVGEKATRENLAIARLQANIVSLDCLRGGSADYCTCMFSTLGMIFGRENRQQALRHVARILKPGGLFVLHVHNAWFGLLTPIGRRWLARQSLRALFRRDVELGDKFFDYRGIPNMFLHAFTRRELVRSLRDARFRLRELMPLHVSRHRTLACPWLFGSIRANGWIAVCQAPSD